MALKVRRIASTKVRLIATLIAVFAFVVQPYVGLAFNQVANALNDTSITLTPSTVVVSGGETGTSTGDAANYSDLSLTFHYNITNLESTDSLQYGWRTSTGADQPLGSLDGQTNTNGKAGADEVGVKTVSLPSDAAINGLTLYFKNNGNSTKPNSDTATIANLTLQGQKTATPIVPTTVSPVENTRDHKTFTSVQAALADSDTQDNDTIALNADMTTTSFIKITRPITLDGNGHTITATNTVTSSVIDAWYTTGVTISNLTIDGSHGYIRGINVVGADATLNNVTVKNNGKDGLVVNASHVTVDNITTSGNAWDGIDVDKAGAVLTVNGTSSHTETGNAIYLDDTTTGAKVVDTNNQYFISHPNKEGTNPNDRAYNLDHSNLVVDVTSPANNEIVRTPSHKLVVTGTFTATQNGANYLQTQLVYNGNSKGLVTTYGPVTNGTLAEFDTTGLPDGSGYYIALTGTDTLGNVSARKIINFTIDNTQPVAAFTSSTSNPTPNGYYNSDFTVDYSVTDNIQLKGMNISLRDAHDTTGNQWRANCYDNQAETTSSDTGTCTVKLPANLPDGEYYLQIGAQDAAGNWATVATRNVRIQRAAPAQPTNLHAKFQNDSQDAGKYLNVTAKPSGNNLELYWDNPTDWVSGYQVKVAYPNGDSYDLNNDGYQGPNPYAWIQGTFGKHGQGAYIYQVRASNPNGWSAWSDPLTLVYDSQSPTAQFTQAIDNNAFVNKNFHVEATVSDSAELKSAGFDVRNGSGWQAGCVANTFQIDYTADHKSATLSCDINISHLIEGSQYYVRVHAGDYVNYGSKDSAPLSIRNFTVDKTAPSVPANGQPNAAYLKTNTFDFTWDASTDNTNSPLAYEFQSSTNSTVDGNGVLTSGLWQSGTLNSATIHSQGAAFSTWYWQVRARDAAGNYSAWSPVWNVTLDNVHPDSTNNLAALVSGKIVITQTVTDNTAAASGKLRIWKLTNGVADNTKFFAIGDKTVDANGVVTYNLDTVANLFGDGEYTAKFTSTDRAGNASVAQQNFTVDNTPPSVNVGANQSVAGKTAVLPNGTDDQAATLSWQQTAGPGTATFGSFNAKGTDVTVDQYGTYTFELTGTDAAGNTNSDTVNVTFTQPGVAAPERSLPQQALYTRFCQRTAWPSTDHLVLQ